MRNVMCNVMLNVVRNVMRNEMRNKIRNIMRETPRSSLARAVTSLARTARWAGAPELRRPSPNNRERSEW